jgi:transcriptional regulator with XRE-family HTH domain
MDCSVIKNTIGYGRVFMEKGFGDILRDLRLEAKVGLRELARRIHTSPGYLSDVENGRTAPPSEKVIVEMARALNVDKQRLLAAARKVDPELSQYVAQQPQVADFLRTAKDRGYEEDDWIRLSQLADIAKLGKGKGEK